MTVTYNFVLPFSFLAMDFSPYKPSPDEDRKDRLKGKGKSRSPATASYEPVPTSSSSYQAGGNVPPSLYEEGLFTPGPSLGPSMGGAPGGTVRVNKYETRLPIRVDLEAALAYILGPVTGKIAVHLSFAKESFALISSFALANSATRYPSTHLGDEKRLCQVPCMAGTNELLGYNLIFFLDWRI